MATRAVFLDRDGVINEHVGLLYKPKQLKLLPNSSKAIKILNSSGFLVIVVTNQPVVARNLCSIEDVEKINNKLLEMLKEKGAVIDKIYFCPHHPDKGYPEENKSYKVKCRCRKPDTGMFEQAEKDFNIIKEGSYMVGDTTSDIKAGSDFGIKTILVRTGEAGRDKKYKVSPDFVVEDLLEAARLITDDNI